MTETKALLLTDVVDSTKLSEQLGNEAMAQVWTAHDRVARDLLHRAGGREIDKTDGMLLMFDFAADAVDYALAYHRALAELPVPLKARAGLHVGPVILRENSAEDVARGAKPIEVDGIAKPTAARVMALAHGGQLLLTPEARDALGRTKLRTVSHGHWQMKGLGEPVELFEVGEAEAAFVPPADGDKGYRVVRVGDRWLTTEELPNNLPQQITSFIGRERELAEVKSLLDRERLLTLLGMGGLGKTRLSLQVAAEVRHQYPDGVWFIDLAPVRDESLVVGETAQVLGVRESPDRPLLQSICAFVKTRKLLLIFDNCEHLVRRAADLANAILRAASQVRVLASSREALRVPGEQIYPVVPLPVPARDATLEALTHSTAVRLFVERARLQKPGFDISERDAAAVAELVARLEGIPLAIELAAARVRALPVAEINVRLKDRYKLLTGGGRVLLERQQTLRALVDWSYELLSDSEQCLLQRLAVFRGGFDLQAAEQVCGVEPLEPMDLLDLLGSLVDKSLLMLDEREQGSRYRMLETIRDYAREKLEQSGGLAQAAARHCDYYFTLAKAIRVGLRGADQAEWIGRAETDLDNLRAATALSLAGGVDPFIAVKFAVALQGFWALRGYVTEGREVVRTALEVPAIQASDVARAHALYVGAALAYCQSDHAQARSMLETCLELRRRLDSPIDLAGTLSTLSMARLQAGDAAGAGEGEREALVIFRRLGHRVGEAISLLHLGQIALYGGADESARSFVDESLQIAREIKHRELEGECERVLGEVAFEAGDLVSATDRLQRSLSVCRDAGDKRGQASAEWWLAKVELEAGNVAQARSRLKEALTAFRALEMREEAISCLEDMAVVLMIDGSQALALRLVTLCFTVREKMGLKKPPRQEQRWRRHASVISSASDSASEHETTTSRQDQDFDYAIRAALAAAE